MDEYFIGAGALLTAGEEASITGATLHAQPVLESCPAIEAAVIDFEAMQPGELSRILIVAAGWTSARFRAEVVRRLLARGECSLADVFETLAEATGSPTVHLFAHWRPDHATTLRLDERGVRIIAHPLEAIGRAALICGQRVERWAA
jgi:hypothetical protein